MDTDELTPMAYDCIRLADAAADVLKTELGAMCSRYRSEDDFRNTVPRFSPENRKANQAVVDLLTRIDRSEQADPGAQG